MSIEKGLESLVKSSEFIDLNDDMQLEKDNIFRVLELERMEIKHSNMLAYLFDPDGSHMFKSMILYELIRTIPGSSIKLTSIKNVTVHREVMIKKTLTGPKGWTIILKGTKHSGKKGDSKRYIDLFISMEINGKKTVLCIENKIGADLGKNQLYDYECAVENSYKKYDKIYVYLTPEGLEPDEKAPAHDPGWRPDKWIPAGYEVIIDAIKTADTKTKSGTSSDATRVLIDNYLELLDKKIVQNNPVLQKKGSDLYHDTRYRGLLDSVFNKKLTGVDKTAYETANSDYEDVFRLLRSQRSMFINKNVPMIAACLKAGFKGFKQVHRGSKNNSEIVFTTDNLAAFFPSSGKDKVEYVLDMRESLVLRISTSVSRGMKKSELDNILKTAGAKSWLSAKKISEKYKKYADMIAEPKQKHFDIVLKSISFNKMRKETFDKGKFDSCLISAITIDDGLV